MADISIQIAQIQTATTGSELRSAIIGALEEINADIPSQYSGPYSVAPSTVSVTVPISGYLMLRDLVVEAYPEPILISKTITENGTYHASNESADGYSQVAVSIPYYGGPYSITPSTVSQTFITTDLLMTSNIIVDAYPEPILMSKTASANGTYNASDDSADGYSQFIVAIPAYSGSYSITPGSVAITMPVAGMIMSQNIEIASATVMPPSYTGPYNIWPNSSQITILSTSGTYLSRSIYINSATTSVWSGTQSAYDALGSYDSNTTYYIIG